MESEIDWDQVLANIPRLDDKGLLTLGKTVLDEVNKRIQLMEVIVFKMTEAGAKIIVPESEDPTFVHSCPICGERHVPPGLNC